MTHIIAPAKYHSEYVPQAQELFPRARTYGVPGHKGYLPPRELAPASQNGMNVHIPWVLGPFFGESPETYFAHRVGMHHPENNLEDDVSTTLPFVRDRVGHVLRYFLRFSS